VGYEQRILCNNSYWSTQMNYLQYDTTSGQIICRGSAPDSADLTPLGYTLAGGDYSSVDFSEDYIENGAIVRRPAKPAPHHDWDWTSKSWLPNLDAAKAAKKTEIETELSRRLYLPCNGFDADNVSRERISGTIARLQRGDGLPAGWLGWRDASNDMHWAADDAATVLANLTALSRAIENREQALLIAAWQHKAAIAALTSVEALLAYDVTAGW
jgi:hypothetical protein